MREFCTSGSGGAAGGQPPAATRAKDRFLGFIVRHIDETIPATMVDSIEQNAREKCPESARNICQTVVKAYKDLRQRVKEEKDGGR